jgi:RND family efflux transporter MFP subunit
MKNVLTIIIVAFLASCSSKVDNPSQLPEDIKKQISEYKSQVQEINNKIAELEKNLKTYESEEEYKITVSLQSLEFSPFHHYVQISGTVEAINMANISPETNGQVKKIYVVEGEKVQKGHILVKLNTSINESAIKELETRLDLAKTVFERQKKLWEKNIGSELDYLTAKNNKESLESSLETLNAQMDLSSIKAPFSGIVDDIFVKEGELSLPGMPVMQLVNLDEIYINADASESYITKINKGDSVMVEFPSYPDIKAELPVYRVGNVVKPANRSFNIQLKMHNPDGMLKPNIVAMIKINDFYEEKAITVPTFIIKKDIKGDYVYVAREKNNTMVAEKKYIETGLSYNDQSHVIKGLEPGQKVIVSGYNMVSDGVAIDTKGN